MKKIATILTAIVMLFATSSFASDGDNVTALVKTAFQHDFSGASQVDWEKTSDYYVASFNFNNTKVSAAYNEDGELVGTSRKIASAQMPLSILLELGKKYEDYFISENAFEVTNEGQTSYYINVDNGKQVLQLKCYSSGEVDVIKKTKKQVVEG